MKKNLNKLATLALTGMMVAGMSFGAMAATAPEKGTGEGKWNGSTVTDNSFSFTKYLDKKETYTSIPHVKFAFETKATLTSDSTWDTKGSTLANPEQIAGTGEKNNEGNYTLPIYYGESGLKATVEFGKTEDGKVDTKENQTVTFTTSNGSAVSFTKSGIYRFAVEEDWASDFDQNGLYKVTYTKDGNETTESSVKMNTNDVKYMDVYVVNGDTEGTFKISNVVLMTNAKTALTTTTQTVNGKSVQVIDYDNAKLSGVNNEYTTKHTLVPGEDPKDNMISIEKDLAGSIKNESEEFTFKVYFTNVPSDFTVKTAYKIKTTTAGEGGQTTVTWSDEANKGKADGEKVTVEGTDYYITVTLKDNEKVEITGLPLGVKYRVVEASNSNYEASVTLDDTAVTLENDGWTLNRSTDGLTTDDFVDNIVWTNTREDITVTGVAMNIAPYAAMVLGAGAFAGIFLGGKRRRAEDED